jgi:hypothetical protein
MVIRILAVPDSLDLFEFDEVFRAVLGWDNIGFLWPKVRTRTGSLWTLPG